MYKQSLWHQASFIKRDLFMRFGKYNTLNRFCSDWEFFLLTIIVHKVKAVYINETISLFDTTGSTWNINNQSILKQERTTILNKYFPEGIIELLEKYDQLQTQLIKIKRTRLFRWQKRLATLKQLIVK